MTTKGAETRRRLMEAAAAEIALHGPEAKLRDIAGRLGLTQPAIYRHFKSRDEVHAAVVDVFRQKLRQLIHEALIPPDAQVDDLRSLTSLAVTNLMVFLERNRDAMTVALLQEPDGEVTRQQLIAMIASNVEEEVAAGHFRAGISAEFFATCLVGIVVQFMRFPSELEEIGRRADTIAEILLEGIKTRETPAATESEGQSLA